MHFEHDVVVVGGCGHVGLPLGIAFASRGLNVVLYDTSAATVDTVNQGVMPFQEAGASAALPQVLDAGRLNATTDPSSITGAEHVIVVVGTPIDRHLSPDIDAVTRVIASLTDYLVPGQLVVLRSTVYPGSTRRIARIIANLARDIDVSFCPERIAEGHALEEVATLPQIVSGSTPRAAKRAAALFRHVSAEIVELEPDEAELAKLFTNTWRYVKFAMANQLYMIANDSGLDYERIRQAVAYHYPRAADLPGAGLAAGPCLLKDTMQIAAFAENRFTLGHTAVMVNEGLPLYVIGQLEKRFDLADMTVGILGMAFKPESDDIRSSLSYRLKRVLIAKAAGVLCTDPFVTADPGLVSLEKVLADADLIVIATPHQAYKAVASDKPIVDLTNLLGHGVKV
jgi:UDP-N-acetyl-D-mannosaminuronic acid dehydrogenase